MIEDHDVLAHFGVKGMRWGVRKTVRSAVAGKVAARRSAKNAHQSEDAQAANAASSKLKKTGIKSLTNKEIKTLNERMQLEQSLRNLQANQPNTFRRGHAVVKEIVGVGQTAVGVFNLANSPLAKAGLAIVKAK